MNNTAENVELANEIIKLIANKKCTIADARSVLDYVSRELSHHATVQQFELSVNV